MRTNPEKTADLFTFTKKILNGTLHFCLMEVRSIYSDISLIRNELSSPKEKKSEKSVI